MRTFKEIAKEQAEFIKFCDMNESVDYDIKKKYVYYNKLLFEGNLPMVPLKFRRTKKAGGSVKIEYYTSGRGSRKRVDDFKILELYLSTFKLRTEEQMDQILVHEMIHVWMAVNGLHEGYNVELHGNEFVQKKNELQHKLPFEIPMADYLESEIRNKKNKEYGVIIGKGKLGSIVAVIKKEVLEKDIDKIKEMTERAMNKGTELIIGISSNPELEEFPVKRTTRSIAFYEMSKRIQDLVLDDIEVLHKTLL
jgi:hypothetical protein